MGASSRSKASRVETYSVSPPRAGMMRAERIDVSAGTRLKDESVCQSWLALLRRDSRWSAGTTFPSGPMVLRVTKCEPVPCEPTLVTSGGPKRREKASWISSVTSWSRNTRTESSSKAARTTAYTASSAATPASLTPRSSAANPGPNGTISIGKSSLLLLLATLGQNRPAGNDRGGRVGPIARRRRCIARGKTDIGLLQFHSDGSEDKQAAHRGDDCRGPSELLAGSRPGRRRRVCCRRGLRRLRHRPRLRPVAHLGVVSLPMRQKGAKIFRRPNPPEGRSLHCDTAHNTPRFERQTGPERSGSRSFWSKYPTNCRNGGEQTVGLSTPGTSGSSMPRHRFHDVPKQPSFWRPLP